MTPHPLFRGWLAIALASGSLVACTSPGSQVTYIMTLGTDTVGAESIRIGDRVIEGRQLRSWPVASDIRYRVDLGSDGALARYEMEVTRTPFDSVPSQRSELEVNGRALQLRVWGDSGVDSTSLTLDAEPVPALYPSALTHLLMIRRLAAAGADSAEFDMIGPTFNPPMRVQMRREGQDLVRESWPAWGSWQYALRHEADDLTSVDSDRTTERYLIARGEGLDLDRLWAAFAERQLAIGVPRQLSPLDTVEATIGGTALTVEYSRPSHRGREIFGALVPWDQVWRTGAGFTTHLITSAPLGIGGRALAAGKHSLWTLPTADGVTLIVNRQTDTWSTNYDESLDVFRVPMSREQVTDPVDQFTMSLLPAPDGFRLRLEWEREKWEVAITRGGSPGS